MSVQPGVWYKITCKATDTVLDFDQTNKKSLIGYTLHGAPNQIWTLEPANSNNQWYIRNSQGYYISVDQTTENSDVLVTSNKQAFAINRDSGDKSLLRIVHPPTSLCLDLRGANPADGTGVCLYRSNDNARQQVWKFEAVYHDFCPGPPVNYLTNNETKTSATLGSNKNVTGNKHTKASSQIWIIQEADRAQSLYYIKSAETNEYLSLSGTAAPSTSLVGSNKQQSWVIYNLASDSSLSKIQYPGTNMVVDLTGSDPTDGTKIIIQAYSDPGLNQQWKIDPAF